MERPHVSVCIIGDIMLDVVTYLPEIEPSYISEPKGLSMQWDVRLLPGGTASHAALAASREGFNSVTVISKVGADRATGAPDATAHMVLELLSQHGVRAAIVTDHTQPTGTAMITYLAGDRRLFVSDRGANGTFCASDLSAEQLEAARASSILFVSGYSLLAREQAAAVIRLMREASAHGRFVALDVVPHEIYRMVDRSTFQECLELTNLLISEVNTVKRLFPSPSATDADSDVEVFASELLKHFAAVLLRPSNDIDFLFDREGLIEKRETGYPAAAIEEKRGFLDRLAMGTLFRHFHRLVGRDERDATE